MSAIGPKICPSGPCMVNSGMKAQTMISVEKNSGLLDLVAGAQDALLQRQLGMSRRS